MEKYRNLRLADAYPPSEVTFSVVTLVLDWARYEALLESFSERGFTEENTEFLAFDNSRDNSVDGFSWLRPAVLQARGRYVIYCHDDIEAVDGAHDLLSALEHLNETDPSWMLAGNAGHRWRAPSLWKRTKKARKEARNQSRIRNLFQSEKKEPRFFGSLPERVESLDENFFVFRRENFPASSVDLSGFHFHAPDLCLIAEMLGGRSYVIPFTVWHKFSKSYDSVGQSRRVTTFETAKAAFGEKFSRYFPGRRYSCTTTDLTFGFKGWLKYLFSPHIAPWKVPTVPITKADPRRPCPWHVYQDMDQMKGKLNG